MPKLLPLSLIMLSLLALAVPTYGEPAVQVPRGLWPDGALAGAPRPLTLLAFSLDRASPSGLRLRRLPAAYGHGQGYGGLEDLSVEAHQMLLTSLELNAERLRLSLGSGAKSEAFANGAFVLLALSGADLVLEVPNGEGEDPWMLWRATALQAQMVYAAPSAKDRDNAEAMEGQALATFLREALGYDAQIMAVRGSEYLVRLNDGGGPSLGNRAFGLRASAPLLRVANPGGQPGLGLLRLRRADGGWAVYDLLAATAASPWPVGTKLLRSEAKKDGLSGHP